MTYTEITYIHEPERRAAISARVLHALPEWFGLPESTRAYIDQSRALPFWAAFAAGEAIGFVTLQPTSRHTAEVHCMGVLPNWHRRGVGRLLMHALEAFAISKEYSYLQVKTVDEGHYPAYDRTIAFYEGVGFKRLEVFPDLWDEWNPCLVLVKGLMQPAKAALP